MRRTKSIVALIVWGTMAGTGSTLLRRSFRQLDLAFWCIHEHPGTLLILALPTLIGLGLLALLVAIVIRTWDLPAYFNAALFGVVYPTIAFWIFTFAPLPCIVFAWRRSEGAVLEPGECFRFVNQRFSRVFPVALRCGFYYPIWYALAGLPFLVFWPRTCLAPMVALFEDERRVFPRARRLLKQESAIHVLAALHFCLLAALTLLVFTPRMLIAGRLLETPLTLGLIDSLWMFELPAGAIVICGIAVSWSMSLTLLYYEIRQLREGESVRKRIRELRQKFGAAPAVAVT